MDLRAVQRPPLPDNSHNRKLSVSAASRLAVDGMDQQEQRADDQGQDSARPTGSGRRIAELTTPTTSTARTLIAATCARSGLNSLSE
jgi:hypothetical protein